MKTFAEVMEGKAQPTLKAIADIFEVPSQRIYSIAKQPIAGQVFDPKVYNWDAINKFISKRIGKEGDKYATMEEVYDAAMARDEELGAADKRRGSKGSSKVVIDLGDGKSMPARRKELNVGDTVYLKKYNDAFTVVYLTDTHVVLRAGENPALTCLSNWTLNQQITEAPKAAATTDVVNEAPANAKSGK